MFFVCDAYVIFLVNITLFNHLLLTFFSFPAANGNLEGE